MTAKQAGFVIAGECSLEPTLLSGVRFRVTALQDRRVIYAFSVDGVIRYIGICDNPKTSLLRRMMRYQAMMGSGNNRRIAEKIREALSAGARVSILALQPKGRLSYGSLVVDLVKGLENPLIKAFRPSLWNIQGQILARDEG